MSLAIAIDPVTNVSLADYTFLPTALHHQFQSTLEGDQGIAMLHFAAEIDLMEGRTISQKVLLVSSQCLYVCTAQGGDVMRSTLITGVEGMLICDEWVCLIVPSEYDLCFRITARHERKQHVNLDFFLGVLQGLIRHANRPTVTPRVVTSHHSLAQRPTKPPPNYFERTPVPIPLLPYSSFHSIQNSHVLYDALLPAHAAKCSDMFRAPQDLGNGYVGMPQQQQQQPAAVASFQQTVSQHPEPYPTQPIATTNAASPTRYRLMEPSGSRAASPQVTFQQHQHEQSNRVIDDILNSRPATATAVTSNSGVDGGSSGYVPPHHQQRQQQQQVNTSRPGSPTIGGNSASPPRSPASPTRATKSKRKPSVSGASAPQQSTLPPNDPLRRFEDPCLELIWAELMNQREQLQKVTGYVERLMEDRYPPEVLSPRKAGGRQVAGGTTSGSPRRPVGSGVKTRMRTPPQTKKQHVDANHATSNETAAEGGGLDSNDFNELTAFQRSLYDQNASLLPPPSQRKTPDNLNPQGALFTRTLYDGNSNGIGNSNSSGVAAGNSSGFDLSGAGSPIRSNTGARAGGPSVTSPGVATRRGRNQHEIMGFTNGQHHQASTRASRASALATGFASLGGEATNRGSGSGAAPNPRWLSPTSSSRNKEHASASHNGIAKKPLFH